MNFCPLYLNDEFVSLIKKEKEIIWMSKNRRRVKKLNKLFIAFSYLANDFSFPFRPPTVLEQKPKQ